MESKEIKLELGLSAISEQICRKTLKKGFHFSLMVIGESGSGKSTLVQNLLMQNIYEDRTVPLATDRLKKPKRTTSIEEKTITLEEHGVRIKFTIIDTPGYSDFLNSADCWKPIENFILTRFQEYFREEYGIDRRSLTDNRVHCCLVFVPPLLSGLRPMEIETMRALQDKVNLIPIISKADSLTKHEKIAVKSKILADLETNKIQIYEMPDFDESSDLDKNANLLKRCLSIKNAVPFAIVSSNAVIDVKGKKILARLYPWGMAEVENPEHSDFCLLQQMLIGVYMQDLKDFTHEVHYEKFRTRKLAEVLNNQSSGQHTSLNPPFLETLTQAENTEKEKLLKAKEKRLEEMEDTLRKMREKINSSSNVKYEKQTSGFIENNDLSGTTL